MWSLLKQSKQGEEQNLAPPSSAADATGMNLSVCLAWDTLVQ